MNHLKRFRIIVIAVILSIHMDIATGPYTPPFYDNSIQPSAYYGYSNAPSAYNGNSIQPSAYYGYSNAPPANYRYPTTPQSTYNGNSIQPSANYRYPTTPPSAYNGYSASPPDYLAYPTTPPSAYNGNSIQPSANYRYPTTSPSAYGYTPSSGSLKKVSSENLIITIYDHNVSTDTEFRTRLTAAGSKLVVAFFTGSFCVPCKTMKPSIQNLAIKHSNVEFLEIDVNICIETTTIYRANLLPQYVFIKNSSEVDRITHCSINELELMLLKHN